MSRRIETRNRVVGRAGAAAFVLTVNALVLGLCHDRSWAAADDGHYAHLAERLLESEILRS